MGVFNCTCDGFYDEIKNKQAGADVFFFHKYVPSLPPIMMYVTRALVVSALQVI